MQTRTLGKDGAQVTAICLGTWPIGGAFSAVPEQQAVATVRACIDHGITFLDTAEGYGVSEARVGKAIEGRRDEVFLATKVSGGDNTPEHIREAIDNSLKSLGTDRVDLYQVHAPSSETPIEDTMAEMLRQRDAGKLRYVGVSNFDEDMMSEAQECGPVHSSQPRYSMLFRESEESILPFCLENGIGTMAYSVMAKGMLGGRYKPGHEFAKDDERSGWSHFQDQKVYDVIQGLSDWAADHGRTLPQLAIAWVLANPAVTTAIVGCRKPEQVPDNAQAGNWVLTEDELEEVEAIQGDLRLGVEKQPSWRL